MDAQLDRDHPSMPQEGAGNVRLEEREQVERAAQALGLKAAAWARSILLQAARRNDGAKGISD